MHRSHRGLGPAVIRALDVFIRALGPEVLTLHPDMEGDWHTLDDKARERIRRDLLEGEYAYAAMASASNGVPEFLFEYTGVSLETANPFDEPGRSCVATFQLSTEYLEQHGPGQVRELALELASHLPFNSGYASLSFNAIMDLVGVRRRIRHICFRYPGMEIVEDSAYHNMGTRIPGAHWLTFLGPPVLGELGGVQGLRSRLSSPDTHVQPLKGDRAVVTLGQWPEAGDLEAGKNLPAYRELARILEPWLYHSNPDSFIDPDFPPADKLRWERRFLD
ncbi:DUF3396 domain-containing protein [Pyxidicoccus fallax]|uniref:DUF3396 domain-containing protein n=2 Tax=Pyxidicoccus fallax TaxID=394095 RepID=A0A848LUE2_9BACT|nr:DUF3396 domain-containing protein [Pyxidicoccus fallax]NPC84419.1 DUF3396 domain-containing protein [Pyxidicoccus fallax]